MREMNREELIELVESIMAGSPGLSEEEGSRAVQAFADSVPHPRASGLIFYWSEEFDHEPSAEEIVDRALSYKPFQL
jgi:hypothetical protein